MISCQPKNIELIRNFETEKKNTHTQINRIFFEWKKLKVFYKKSSIYSRLFETEKSKIKNTVNRRFFGKKKLEAFLKKIIDFRPSGRAIRKSNIFLKRKLIINWKINIYSMCWWPSLWLSNSHNPTCWSWRSKDAKGGYHINIDQLVWGSSSWKSALRTQCIAEKDSTSIIKCGSWI